VVCYKLVTHSGKALPRMKSPIPAYALSVCAIIALLTGCNGSQLSLSMAQLRPEGDVRRSVGPDYLCAKQTSVPLIASRSMSQALLYVSNRSGLCVYSYPLGRLMPALTLSGFTSTRGLCSDAAGNVFVVDQGASDVIEYTHGGTTPILTLSLNGDAPLACSVDAKTGNLAVTANGSSRSYVAIYKKAFGIPKEYSSSQFTFMFFCAYDSKGDLLVDGQYWLHQPTAEFAELSFGSGTLKPITMSQDFSSSPGDLQWDGKYWAIGNALPPTYAIYQVTIMDKSGIVVGSTALDQVVKDASFYIDKSNVLVPNDNASNSNIQFYKYPAGGLPFKTITKGSLYDPIAAVVSRSPATLRRQRSHD
jgi:hypothetical protein